MPASICLAALLALWLLLLIRSELTTGRYLVAMLYAFDYTDMAVRDFFDNKGSKRKEKQARNRLLSILLVLDHAL